MKSIHIAIILMWYVSLILAHDHPMVGVISFPYKANKEGITSYIQVETAKFIESSGARNVAIFYNQPWSTSVDMLSHLNGLVVQNNFENKLTDSTFASTLKNAYWYATDANDKGTVFPLWASGTSALQMLEQISSNKDLSKFTVNIDAIDYSTTLKITEPRHPSESISLTASISDSDLSMLESEKISYFNQNKGITVNSIKNDPFLQNNFDVVATAVDRKGTEFIAIMKSKKYPIFLSFVLFESVYNFYPSTKVPHSIWASRMSVHISNSFTNYCRQNERAYADVVTEYKNNIFNYKVTTSIEKEYMTFYFSTA